MTGILSPKQRAALLCALVAIIALCALALSHTLLPFFVAFALVYLLNPIVTALSRMSLARGARLGRLGGILVVYVGFFLVLYVLSLFVVPQLYREFAKLALDLPDQLLRFERETFPQWLGVWQQQLDLYHLPIDLKTSVQNGVTQTLSSFESQLGSLAQRLREVVTGIFSTLLNLVLIFMLTGFLLYDLPRLKLWTRSLIPQEFRPGVIALARDIDRGLAGAVRGQLGVCLINAILTTVGLLVLNVKFAVTLGIIAGVLSLIPVFGTLVSTVPAVIVGLTQSLVTALLVLAWILVIHLIEANLLNPKIIGHNAELHPALVVLALLLGEHYGGAAGLLVAVPIATVIRSLLTYTLGALLKPPPEDEPELALAEALKAPVTAPEEA